jgi:hypothetical protein
LLRPQKYFPAPFLFSYFPHRPLNINPKEIQGGRKNPSALAEILGVAFSVLFMAVLEVAFT